MPIFPDSAVFTEFAVVNADDEKPWRIKELRSSACKLIPDVTDTDPPLTPLPAFIVMAPPSALRLLTLSKRPEPDDIIMSPAVPLRTLPVVNTTEPLFLLFKVATERMKMVPEDPSKLDPEVSFIEPRSLEDPLNIIAPPDEIDSTSSPLLRCTLPLELVELPAIIAIEPPSPSPPARPPSIATLPPLLFIPSPPVKKTFPPSDETPPTSLTEPPSEFLCVRTLSPPRIAMLDPSASVRLLPGAIKILPPDPSLLSPVAIESKPVDELNAEVPVEMETEPEDDSAAVLNVVNSVVDDPVKVRLPSSPFPELT
jgi:hypothetical protein